MKIPTIEGTIAWRILLNYRADPAVVRRLVPEPLQVATTNGFAVVGVCLIRLEHLRPKGMPARFGLAADNAAHRIAVRHPVEHGTADGVFILRRETDCRLIAQLGGRLFPGVHRLATFSRLSRNGVEWLEARTEDGAADVAVGYEPAERWQPTELFPDLDAVRCFFEKGDCGYSCSLDRGSLEGMRLRPRHWDLGPFIVHQIHSAIYDNLELFPPGSITFDGGAVMRNVLHEWQVLDSIPDHSGGVLSGVATGPR